MTTKGDVSPYASSERSSADVKEEAQVALEQLDSELVKKTWRRVDWHIMPIAVWLYLASYIDR